MYLRARHWSKKPYGKLWEMDIHLSLIHALKVISMLLPIKQDTNLAAKVRMHGFHPNSLSTRLRMKKAGFKLTECLREESAFVLQS